MIRVAFSRTVSVNYQSGKVGVEFETDQIPMSRAMNLAMFLVKVRLQQTHSADDLKQFSGDYEAVFGEPLSNYLKLKNLLEPS